MLAMPQAAAAGWKQPCQTISGVQIRQGATSRIPSPCTLAPNPRQVSDAKRLTVKSVVEKDERKTRPCGLNTVEMLRVASTSLNMGPSQTMHVSQPALLYLVAVPAGRWVWPVLGGSAR